VNTEKEIALQEAATAHDSDAYFKARPAFDTDASRTLFESGHKRGFEAGMKAALQHAGQAIGEYTRTFDNRSSNTGRILFHVDFDVVPDPGAKLCTTPQPAAPELCAALQSFVDCWSDESGFSNPHPEDVSRAKALLSAAKGEK
jgi:hypothetical protein